MDVDSIMAALKITGAAIGGALGALGLLADFKTENGTLSRAGKLVLGGIIISAVVGVLTSSIESYKAKSDSSEQLSRLRAGFVN